MNGDPTRGDVGDGYRADGTRVERRSPDERRKGWYVPRSEFSRWKRRRALPAFLALVAASVISAFLGYTAGRDSDHNLTQAGADSVYRSCLSRADIRITTAQALDGLRAAALRPPVNDAEREAQARFFARTQGPINDLLEAPAGHKVHTVGRLDPAYLDALRVRATMRCATLTVGQFGVKPNAPDAP